MVTSVTKGGTQKLPPKFFKLLKHTDMTIHWKMLEEHFLMVPLVFLFNHFRGKMHLLNFSPKKSVLELRKGHNWASDTFFSKPSFTKLPPDPRLFSPYSSSSVSQYQCDHTVSLFTSNSFALQRRPGTPPPESRNTPE
jgi:hypothetical protein